MGGFVRCRWVKLLALLSLLVPLALQAGSLLAHVAPPPLSSPQPAASAFIAGAASKSGGSAHNEVGQRRRRTEGSALSTALGTRFRHAGQAAGFGDDKRMAPSGSNPLHNLRR